MRKHKGEINIGEVDCTTEAGQLLCEDYKVQSYPTLLYFAPDTNSTHRFSKSRNIDELETFAFEGGYKKKES